MTLRWDCPLSFREQGHLLGSSGPSCHQPGLRRQTYLCCAPSVGPDARDATPVSPENIALRQRELFSRLKIYKFFLLDLNLFGTHPCFLFLLFIYFGMAMSLLRLSHCCILEVNNFSGFISSQLKRNFPSGWLTPQVSGTLEADGI